MFQRCPSPENIKSAIHENIKSNKIDDHTCHFNTCKIKNLPVEIHQLNDKYYVRSRFTPKFNWFSNDTLVKKIYSIYICMDTGKLHYCHIACDGDRMTNVDNCQVCCISGLQYQSESVRSWQLASRCIQTVVADKRDPNLYSRDALGRVKNSGIHNLKTAQCILMCGQYINNLLYSVLRMECEKKKFREQQKEAEKIVSKYKRHCEKQNIPKNYIHMLSIYANQIKKRPLYTQFIMIPKNEQKKYIDLYTREIIAYWKTILHKTKLGRQTPNLFAFKNFIPACLFIMKNGLICKGLYIINKHVYLDSSLPEANTLDVYGINKPSFTQSKNNILESLREFVENNEQNPKLIKDHINSEINKIKLDLV
jgi:hypothetical protein